MFTCTEKRPAYSLDYQMVQELQIDSSPAKHLEMHEHIC